MTGAPLKWTKTSLEEIDGIWVAGLTRVFAGRTVTETLSIGRCRREIAERLLNAFLKHDRGPSAAPFYTEERVEILNVDAAMACAWVRLNTHNRTISENWLIKYGAELEAGAWELAHGVTFTSSGWLADGQHRLWTIVLYAIDVRMTVLFGASERAQEVADQGGHRNAQNVMELSYGWTGAKEKRTVCGGIVQLVEGNQVRVTPRRLHAIYQMHAAAIEWASGLARSAWFNGHRPNKPFLVALTVAYERHPEEMKALAHSLKTGAEIADGSAAQRLIAYANALRGEEDSSRSRGRNARRVDSFKTIVSKVLRACLAHLRDERLQKLYDTDEGFNYFVPDKAKLLPPEL